MKLFIFCFLILINQLSSKTISVEAIGGYDDNVFQEELSSKTSYLYTLKGTFNKCIKWKNHCPGAFGYINRTTYNDAQKQNYLLYTAKPYYIFQNKEKYKINASYSIKQAGELSTQSNKDFRKQNIKDVHVHAELYSQHKSLVIHVETSNKETEEDLSTLDYLNNTQQSIKIAFDYMKYPESLLGIYGKYTSYAFNQEPSSTYREEDTNMVEGALLWASTISPSVNLKLKIFERLFYFEETEKKMSTNFLINITTKLSANTILSTKYEWVTERHRSQDSLMKKKKGFSFNAKYKLSHDWSGICNLSYFTSAYNEPHERNNLNFHALLKFEWLIMSNLISSLNYHFDFVRSDDTSKNIYGEDVSETFRSNKVLIGLKAFL